MHKDFFKEKRHLTRHSGFLGSHHELGKVVHAVPEGNVCWENAGVHR